jgi:hypothetical protein
MKEYIDTVIGAGGVYLSVGGAGRVARRYRGKDVFRWLDATRLSNRMVDQLKSPRDKFRSNPHLSGTNVAEEQKIKNKEGSKRAALNGSLTRRAVFFAKAPLSSSLSTEEKLSRLSTGIWIPYRPL